MKWTNFEKPDIPIKQNESPVKIVLRMYDIMVVAMMTSGLSLPTLVTIVKAILWKNGTTSIFKSVSKTFKLEMPLELTISEPTAPLKALAPAE